MAAGVGRALVARTRAAGEDIRDAMDRRMARFMAMRWDSEDNPLRDMAAWLLSGDVPERAWFAARGLAGGRGFAAEESDLAFALLRLRESFITTYGFSIPCREALDVLAAHGPILELGAGTGYWTRMLRSRGVDAVATDLRAGEVTYGFTAGSHVKTARLDGQQAVRWQPDRTLFCSWPGYGEPWLAEVVEEIPPGRVLVLIGEDQGGCTGDDRLFELLDDEGRFEPLGDVAIPQFSGIHDRMTIHRRRG